mgnify:CR=1 FL=1
MHRDTLMHNNLHMNFAKEVSNEKAKNNDKDDDVI